MATKLPKLTYATPLAPLQWANIKGQGKLKYDPEGKLDKNDPTNYIYTIQCVLTKEQADEFEDMAKKFWNENKPSGLTKQKYTLTKPVVVPTLDADGKEQKDEDGAVITHETGMFTLEAKTNAVWPDGSANTIKVMRANKAPLNLGTKVIGEGSEGVIHGSIGISTFKGNEGLAFYLTAVQLKKFVEYVGGGEVKADDLGEDEGMEGLDMDEAEAEATPPTNTPAI